MFNKLLVRLKRQVEPRLLEALLVLDWMESMLSRGTMGRDGVAEPAWMSMLGVPPKAGKSDE